MSTSPFLPRVPFWSCPILDPQPYGQTVDGCKIQKLHRRSETQGNGAIPQRKYLAQDFIQFGVCAFEGTICGLGLKENQLETNHFWGP